MQIVCYFISFNHTASNLTHLEIAILQLIFLILYVYFFNFH